MTLPDNNHAYTPVAKAIPIDGGLGESFISSPAETVSPDATAYLEVVSPSTLPEVCISYVPYLIVFLLLYLSKDINISTSYDHLIRGIHSMQKQMVIVSK